MAVLQNKNGHESLGESEGIFLKDIWDRASSQRYFGKRFWSRSMLQAILVQQSLKSPQPSSIL